METCNKARSVPGVSVLPEDGRMVALKTSEFAAKVVPSNSCRSVKLSEAVNVAEVNSIVLGNSRAAGMKDPGPKSPRLNERLVVGVVSNKVLFWKVRELKTGKSGGSANPPREGPSVKLLIVKLVTPGAPGASGISVSKEMKPRLMVVAAAGNTNTAIRVPTHRVSPRVLRAKFVSHNAVCLTIDHLGAPCQAAIVDTY